MLLRKEDIVDYVKQHYYVGQKVTIPGGFGYFTKDKKAEVYEISKHLIVFQFENGIKEAFTFIECYTLANKIKPVRKEIAA